MRTLAPGQTILRVTDKLYAPLFEDQRVNAGAILLYMRLVQLTGKKDCCCPSRLTLATACKMSIRSVKAHVRKLVELGYVQIVPVAKGAEACGH